MPSLSTRSGEVDTTDDPPYTEYKIDVPIDHMNRDAGTFKIRVLVQNNGFEDSSV